MTFVSVCEEVARFDSRMWDEDRDKLYHVAPRHNIFFTQASESLLVQVSAKTNRCPPSTLESAKNLKGVLGSLAFTTDFWLGLKAWYKQKEHFLASEGFASWSPWYFFCDKKILCLPVAFFDNVSRDTSDVLRCRACRAITFYIVVVEISVLFFFLSSIYP